MPPPILRIRAAFWLSGPLAKQRGATLAAAAIPGVRIAKLIASAACRMCGAPTLTARPPAIRPIYASTAHIGRVRPAYLGHLDIKNCNAESQRAC
eukprot:1510381-Pleurochrysis_carterae.AAC.1